METNIGEEPEKSEIHHINALCTQENRFFKRKSTMDNQRWEIGGYCWQSMLRNEKVRLKTDVLTPFSAEDHTKF